MAQGFFLLFSRIPPETKDKEDNDDDEDDDRKVGSKNPEEDPSKKTEEAMEEVTKEEAGAARTGALEAGALEAGALEVGALEVGAPEAGKGVVALHLLQRHCICCTGHAFCYTSIVFDASAAQPLYSAAEFEFAAQALCLLHWRCILLDRHCISTPCNCIL